MKHIKIFESEVSSGNASGKAGVGSIPFGRGYFQSGANNGAPGITFTPEGEPSFKTYKSMKHSKKNVKEKIKKMNIMKKYKDFKANEDACATLGNTGGMGAIVASQPSGTPGDVQGSAAGSGDVGQTLGTYTKPALNLKKDKKKKKRNIETFDNFNPKK